MRDLEQEAKDRKHLADVLKDAKKYVPQMLLQALADSLTPSCYETLVGHSTFAGKSDSNYTGFPIRFMDRGTSNGDYAGDNKAILLEKMGRVLASIGIPAKLERRDQETILCIPDTGLKKLENLFPVDKAQLQSVIGELQSSTFSGRVKSSAGTRGASK